MQNYILTNQSTNIENPSTIIPWLERYIIRGNISKIWVIQNDDDSNFNNINDDYIEINVGKQEGKRILSTIISLCVKKMYNEKEYKPLIFVLENQYIDIKLIFFSSNKDKFDNDLNNVTFQRMLRSFILITKQDYTKLTQFVFNKNIIQ